MNEPSQPKPHALWNKWGRLFPTKSKIGITGILLLAAMMIQKSSAERGNSQIAVSDVVPYTRKVASSEPITDAQALQARVEYKLNEILGEDANWLEGTQPRVMGVTLTRQLEGPDLGGYLLQARYRADEGITLAAARGKLLRDAIRIVRGLRKDASLSAVKIYFLMPMLPATDSSDVHSSKQAGKFLIRSALTGKSNWNDMSVEIFEQTLRREGQFWLDPALETKERSE